MIRKRSAAITANMNAIIAIPSKGRAGKMLVAKKVLPQVSHKFRIYIVVEPQEEQAYREAYPEYEIVVLPDNNRGIGYSRRQIQSMFNQEIILMLDDDVEGYCKRSGELTAGGYPKLATCHPVEALEHLIALTEKYKIACLSHKPQNWMMSDPPGMMLMWNTVGLHPDLAIQHHVLYEEQAQGFEDYEITAQAVKAGLRPYMSPHFSFNTSLAIGVLPGGLQMFDRAALQEKSIEFIREKWGDDCMKVIVNKKSGRREVRMKWRNILKKYGTTK